MKNKIKFFLIGVLLTVSIAALADIAGTQRWTENFWFAGDRKIQFGDFPNASINYSSGNLIVDVTHGGGTVLFPHGASVSGGITGNASTATALAANPTDCASHQFATTIAANGNLTCAALVDLDIPDALTIAGGLINSTVIGNVTPAAAAFTTVAASGTIKSSNSTGVGAHKLSGANTACNTTCSSGGCLFGFDLAAGASQPVLVECTDATADTCLCLQ